MTTGGPGLFWVQPIGLIGGVADVCLVARNIGAGTDTRFACTAVGIAAAAPVGAWEWVATNSAAQIGFFGWALDYENLGWIQVLVTVDNRRYVLRADQARPDRAGSFPPGYGVEHGWSATVDAGKGNHTVCVSAIDFPTGSLTSFGCRNLVIK
jgi:hypothetical protein